MALPEERCSLKSIFKNYTYIKIVCFLFENDIKTWGLEAIFIVKWTVQRSGGFFFSYKWIASFNSVYQSSTLSMTFFSLGSLPYLITVLQLLEKSVIWVPSVPDSMVYTLQTLPNTNLNDFFNEKKLRKRYFKNNVCIIFNKTK